MVKKCVKPPFQAIMPVYEVEYGGDLYWFTLIEMQIAGQRTRAWSEV